LDRIEGFAQRLIADRVDRELEAFRLRVGAPAIQILGVVDANATRVGFVRVWRAEPRGVRAERAVAEKLAGAEAQAVIAETGADAMAMEGVDRVVHRHADDAN